jgi:acetoacetate decarboxylase
MSETEVLCAALAMSLTSLVFPPGSYHFVDRECINIT